MTYAELLGLDTNLSDVEIIAQLSKEKGVCEERPINFAGTHTGDVAIFITTKPDWDVL